MKVDVYGHAARYERWKQEVVQTGEEGLTKKNSDLLIRYVFDMEIGANVSKSSQKGPRGVARLNTIRQRIAQIMRIVQERGIDDVTKKNKHFFTQFEKTLTKLWSEMERGTLKTHNGTVYKSTDTYQRIFKAFWHWWMKIHRKEGVIIPDITEDWGASQQETPKFVHLTKEELDKLLPYFTLDEQTILLFMFDSIIRAPTELMSLKGENITHKGDEVWVNVPDEVSKTFGRSFNLVFSGKALIEYISRNKSKPEDYLFKFAPPLLNTKLKKVAKQVFGEKLSDGGDYYKNLTLYDFRHSGAIHFRPLVKNIDKLRHRGGWTNLKMINYYTKFLNMTGQIEKEDMLIEEERSKLEQEVERLKKDKEVSEQKMKSVTQGLLELEDQFKKFLVRGKKVVVEK